MTARPSIYRGFVQRYNASTGVVSCTIPKLYGTTIITARPAVGRSSEIPSISPPAVNSIVFVFFDGGADNSPFWIPRVLDSAYSDLYVNVAGDTMTGALFGTDITLSGAFAGTTGAYSGDVAVNGGDVTTTASTATLFNTGAASLNIGGAATTVTIGAGGGAVTMPGDLALNGGDLTTTATTATLFNTNATTVNVAQAATTISIGALTGTTTVRNNLSVTGTFASSGALSSSSSGVNEQMTIQVTGSPTGGTFTLFIAGVPVILNHNSSVASTDSALNAALGAGSVTVTGGSFPGSTQTVTFTGGYGGALIPLVILAANQLTGGSSPNVNLTYPVAGLGAVSGGSVSGNNIVSGTRAVFEAANFTSAVLASSGSALTVRTSGAATSAIVVPASSHPTSERAGITLGTWVVGQDISANGGGDYFLWNGATRFAIAADGSVTIGGSLGVGGALTAASINSTLVRAQDGVNEGGQIDLQGAGAFATWAIDNFQGALRFIRGTVQATWNGAGDLSVARNIAVGGDSSGLTGALYLRSDYDANHRIDTYNQEGALPWCNGGRLIFRTGFSFYSMRAGDYRMGFRGNEANTMRYFWVADGSLFGQQPNDSNMYGIVNIIGTGGINNTAMWFSAMPSGSVSNPVYNNFGNLVFVSSREALKENIVSVDTSAALGRLQRLRPVEFTFKPDRIHNGNEFTPLDLQRGFIAEEVAAADHTYGTFGWLDDKGDMLTTVEDVVLDDAVPLYWDHGAVIADLVAAVQGLSLRVQDLEATLST